MYTKNLMKEILSHENIELAIGQVRRNKGKPGVDGILGSLDEFMNFQFIKGIYPQRTI